MHIGFKLKDFSTKILHIAFKNKIIAYWISIEKALHVGYKYWILDTISKVMHIGV